MKKHTPVKIADAEVVALGRCVAAFKRRTLYPHDQARILHYLAHRFGVTGQLFRLLGGTS